MNKKFFCALTIAGMLMSPVSVLAEEMEEVEAGSVSGSDVEQAKEIALDEVNFPDDNFRKCVKLAYGKVNTAAVTGVAAATDLSYANADTAVPSKTKAKLSDLEKILTLSPDVADPTAALTVAADITKAQLAADYFNTSAKPTAATTAAAMPFKDLTGIEYLTGLQYLSILNSPQLKVADLSKNENLISVTIVALQAAGNTASTFGKTLTTATGTNPENIKLIDLYSIVLPEETANLENLTVAGAEQLTTLDLSAYDNLVSADLQLNELADLNVSGCSSLVGLNVSGNDLTGIDLSGNKSLDTAILTNNKLYEVSLPSSKKFKHLIANNNKLATIDLSGVSALELLDVSDNRLESLDLSSTPAITGLNVDANHLATLDTNDLDAAGTAGTKLAASFIPVSAIQLSAAGAITVTDGTGANLGNQYLYANVPDAGIDLASYDENFQAEDTDNVGWYKHDPAAGATPAIATDSPIGGTITKAGVFEFSGSITPTGGATGTTGISYLYAVGKGVAASTYMTVNIVQADLMNRLYNPNSGEHFYTADLNEKDVLVGLGWQDEGIGWIAPQENYPTTPVQAGEAVFRLYNKNAGDHHYTKDSKEKDALVRAGWDYEGVGWYSGNAHSIDTTQTPPTVTNYTIEVYREYNPNAKEAGAHNYTTSENENDTLVSIGWLDEGIGWWALK